MISSIQKGESYMTEFPIGLCSGILSSIQLYSYLTLVGLLK
jgi:hypothetical protein